METILVTGANGFTGKYLCQALLAKGHKVVGAGIKEAESDIRHVRMDLRNIVDIKRAIDTIQPTRVIHLAGLAFVGHGDSRGFYEVNLLGTENLLSALTEVENQPKSILLASSANVYGVPDVPVITEAIATKPINHYGISKLGMELIAQTYQTKLPIIIARPFNYTGFGQSEQFVIPKIIKSFAMGEQQLELGALDVSRDFGAINDTVSAYTTMLFSEDCVGEIFNVCSGRATSLRTILDIAESLAGKSPKIVVNPKFVRKNEIKTLCGSYEKLKRATEWEPKEKIEHLLSSMFEAYSH